MPDLVRFLKEHAVYGDDIQEHVGIDDVVVVGVDDSGKDGKNGKEEGEGEDAHNEEL